MGQIIPVILRDLEGLISNAVIEVLRGESPVSNARPLGPSRGSLAGAGGGAPSNETPGGTAMDREREEGEPGEKRNVEAEEWRVPWGGEKGKTEKMERRPR